MSKYEPLREHLARLTDVVWAAKLNEVEGIIGSNLPKSAREHRTWWANSGGSLVHQNAWLDAGWRVERTDLTRDVIVFRRQLIGGTGVTSRSSAAKSPQKIAEKRLCKHMASLRQPATVTLRTEWTVLGDVAKTPCSNTAIPRDAGVVRFATLDGDDVKTVIASAASVQQLYRSIRMEMKGMEGNADCMTGKSIIEAGGFEADTPIECDVVKSGNAWLLTDGRGRKANLDDATERSLVAQLLYLQELQSGRSAKLIKD
ncbi:hypothetical protein E1180_01790 [Roseibium denhamense]|uniref:DUF7662 domain-containing protein n=1 Tax=Roseibium denhamense TaxID=76305 RepID=A0ABY1PMW9_9HYPH|nr:hypothetical protein [Roseibium denhamense]MTI04247.1 hypothetical protein [Roseibium denhamense]SMP37296.1 hypothetical protein SAMN06265374_0044 [Roseibium denhamense]